MINISSLKDTLENYLSINLNRTLPNHQIHNVYTYAVTPPGKLFRPLLASSIFYDLNSKEHFSKMLKNANAPLSLLTAFLELHHAYTLIHDDLPAMDNDNIRRGKPTIHKKYSEWKAILVGDGLLNASYQMLSEINDPQAMSSILKLTTKALGPKGLIQGQILDLETENLKELSFPRIIETHKLKTSRLIQTSILSSFLLSNNDNLIFGPYRTFIDLFKLGHYLGVLFQLIDDLTELNSSNISEHEMIINPWPKYHNKCIQELTLSIKYVKELTDKYKLNQTKLLINSYLIKIKERILSKVVPKMPTELSLDIEMFFKNEKNIKL